MFAARCRAPASAARWKPSPHQKTTGVASANATHSHPEKWNAETSTSGTVSAAATASRRGSESSEWSCACPASCGAAPYPAAFTAPHNSSTDTDSGSKSTLARSVAKFTVADETPSTSFSARSIRAAHDAHVIPCSSSSIIPL